jgi:PTS system mannose-specific IIC component
VSYLALALLAGLAAVERKGFLQAMLSRPVALGPIVGLALGDPAGGLMVAAPLELFWLGAVNLGAALPVHEALGTAAITGGALLAAQDLGVPVTPAIAAVAFAVCAPVALAGRRADRFVEQRANERLSGRASALAAEGRLRAAARMNLLGLALPFAVAAALAPLAAAAARAIAVPLLRAAPGAALPLGMGWLAFAALACASGAKALRAKQAPAVFLSVFAATAAIGTAMLWLQAEVRS